MGKIADLLKERQPQAQQLVDTTNQDVLNGMLIDPLLDEYFPIQTYDTFEMLWLKFSNTASIASVVGFEGEIPSTRTGNLKEASLDVFKLGISHVWTENTFKMIHELEQRSLAQPSLNQVIINMLFGAIEDLPPRIMGLHNLLTWQVIYTGSCDYLDPRSKVRAKLVYPKETTLFPAAKTTTARWSQAATATGLDDLVALNEAYYAIHRRFPSATVMSRKAVNQLLAQTATRNAAIARTASGASATNYVVNRELLQLLLADRQIPPIIEYDNEVVVENADGSTTNTRLLPDTYVTFLSKMRGPGGREVGMGERALGPVVSNEMRPGIYTFPEEVSKEPPVDRVVGVATGVPAIWDSRCLAAQKID